VGGVSRVLDASLVADVAVVVVGNVGVSGCDVATDKGGSGRELKSWELGWRGVGWSDSWWRHSRGAGGGFEAGKVVVVVVVDDVAVVDGGVDVADGGGVGVVNGDVADGSGDATLGTASSRCSKVVIAGSADIRISSLEFCCISSAFVSGFGQGVERARETTRRAQNR
jgi:hypothetical protein